MYSPDQPNPTAQDIFDFVATHLMAQGKRAMRPDPRRPGVDFNVCAYRGVNATSCAIGCLLTDEEAEIANNANSGVATVSALYSEEILPARLKLHFNRNCMESGYTDLLTKLQQIHDQAVTPDTFRQDVLGDLRKLARSDGLSQDVLNSLAGTYGVEA